MDGQQPARGVSAQEFFAAGVPGGTMTAAHLATRIAYSTVHRAANGKGISVATARELESWSKGLAAAVYINASATLRIDDPPTTEAADA